MNAYEALLQTLPLSTVLAYAVQCSELLPVEAEQEPVSERPTTRVGTQTVYVTAERIAA